MTEPDDPINEIMAGMAAGDAAFLFAFIEAYGPKVRWVVRSILEGMGRFDMVRNADEPKQPWRNQPPTFATAP